VQEIAVGQNGDGRLEVFATDALGALSHIWQTAPNNGWSSWFSLGGASVNIVVGRNGDGRLEVFGAAPAGDLKHIWQDWSTATGWSSWFSLGNPTGMAFSKGFELIAAGQNADMRLEILAADNRPVSFTGSANSLWHVWQDWSSTTGWSGWASLGAPTPFASMSGILQVATGLNANGILEACIVGGNWAPWHSWQTSSGAWSLWSQMGTHFTGQGGFGLSEIAVGHNADGRLEAFSIGNDLGLWHIYQQVPWNTGSSANWSDWESLGGPYDAKADKGIKEVVVGRNADGRLEVFAKGPDTALWHIWQTAPNNGWSSWASLGGTLG